MGLRDLDHQPRDEWRRRALQRKPHLKTTFRDVRVTGHTPAKVRLATSIAVAFAVTLRRRFARLMQIVSRDLVLRQTRRNVTLQQRFRRLQINLTPRLELSSQPEKYYRIVERETESRVLRDAGGHSGATPAVERILQRLPLYPAPHRTVAHSEVDKLTARHSSDIAIRKSIPASFAPVEMVTHQPRRASSVPAEPERQIERPQPRTKDWPTEDRHRSTTPIEAINIKQLTDRVVDALDRRLVSGHERLTRR